MIKRFNELMEDIPTPIKVLIGVVLLVINFIIINLFFAVNVFAATLNPDTNQIQVKNIISGTETYVTIGQNQNYTVQVTETVPLFVSNWINLPTGVIDGKWSISFPVATGTTCNDLKQANRFIVSVNDLQYNATKSFTACTISNNVASLQMKYNTTNTIANATFKTIYYVPGQAIGGTYKSYQQTDFVAKDYASNIDIENGVINIINNAIQNATNVMANQNNDTNALIDAIIEQNQTCQRYNYTNAPIEKERYFVSSNGTEYENSNWNISEYIEIHKDIEYTLSYNTNPGIAGYVIYNKDKQVLTGGNLPNNTSITITPSQDGYIRYSISRVSNITTFKGTFCQTNTEAINERLDRQLEFWEEIKQMEDDDAEEQKGLLESIISGIGSIFSFLDDDQPDDPSNSLDSLSTNLGTNSVISDLLLLPVNIYQRVINSINGTCSNYVIGELWGSNLTMTCIDISDIIGSTLYGAIDVIISGFFILGIRKRFIKIFNNITSLKTGGNELE